MLWFIPISNQSKRAFLIVFLVYIELCIFHITTFLYLKIFLTILNSCYIFVLNVLQLYMINNHDALFLKWNKNVPIKLTLFNSFRSVNNILLQNMFQYLLNKLFNWSTAIFTLACDQFEFSPSTISRQWIVTSIFVYKFMCWWHVVI